ncbi:hypothetical protein BRAS3843_2470045 [Bradyrhizobium sp. STM 3843]|nr:hypothetical protein BRAS3843_2470045 [Bradyrhizobium sp. STM 3843]
MGSKSAAVAAPSNFGIGYVRHRADDKSSHCLFLVIPGRAQREPGIYLTAGHEARWIPGSCLRHAPE